MNSRFEDIMGKISSPVKTKTKATNLTYVCLGSQNIFYVFSVLTVHGSRGGMFTLDVVCVSDRFTLWGSVILREYSMKTEGIPLTLHISFNLSDDVQLIRGQKLLKSLAFLLIERKKPQWLVMEVTEMFIRGEIGKWSERAFNDAICSGAF